MTDLRTTATALSLGALDFNPWFESLNRLAPSNQNPASKQATGTASGSKEFKESLRWEFEGF